jgi:hypothetical protein
MLNATPARQAALVSPNGRETKQKRNFDVQRLQRKYSGLH